jgi:glycogen(starch) synthase
MLDATVIEVGYEVANKVGGIYTVLASKAEHMKRTVREYYAIGPYYEKNATVEFEEKAPPEKMGKAFDFLKKNHGMHCRFGTWLVEGKPNCILIDPREFRAKTNTIKREMWDENRIDSLNSDWWYDEPLPWSRAAGIVIEELANCGVFSHKVIAHFHEWLCGAGLLYLKNRKPDIKTVFTTHSTVLGRSIAEIGGEDLYQLINDGLSKKQSVPDQKAYDYKCASKHQLERATAQNAHIFTSVSETIIPECEYILGKKPDVILPNGLNMNRFPLMENLSSMHLHLRNQIRKFAMSYFSPYYDFDSKETLFIFISGRMEFHNKGLDLFIDSLGKLNNILKQNKDSKEIVAFIWVPEHTMERKRTVMENLAMFEHFEEVVEKEGEKIENKIIRSIARGENPEDVRIFSRQFVEDMKRMELQMKAKHDQVPPITPFDLFSENAITKALAKNGLSNKKEDKVKVIYYPAYLSTADGLLGMNYYDAMIGCHVGVFPSYYESWGYTPLEAAALGLQSITTDLSGYGRFIKPHLTKDDMSIIVLKRDNVSYEQSLDELTEVLLAIYSMTKKQRGLAKMRAKHLSVLADWENLIKNYMKAYEAAIKK